MDGQPAEGEDRVSDRSPELKDYKDMGVSENKGYLILGSL